MSHKYFTISLSTICFGEFTFMKTHHAIVILRCFQRLRFGVQSPLSNIISSPFPSLGHPCECDKWYWLDNNYYTELNQNYKRCQKYFHS